MESRTDTTIIGFQRIHLFTPMATEGVGKIKREGEREKGRSWVRRHRVQLHGLHPRLPLSGRLPPTLSASPSVRPMSPSPQPSRRVWPPHDNTTSSGALLSFWSFVSGSPPQLSFCWLNQRKFERSKGLPAFLATAGLNAALAGVLQIEGAATKKPWKLSETNSKRRNSKKRKGNRRGPGEYCTTGRSENPSPLHCPPLLHYRFIAV
ncbi:cytochrome c [Sesbania bispinosa]|nr:cytochrome c [Sesbania bispinosa]